MPPQPWRNRPARQVGPQCPAGGLGQPDACSPVEVLLFGSAARGESGENSDIDLLVVLANGDPSDPNWTPVNICEAIGYRPRADVVVAPEVDLRKAARSLAGMEQLPVIGQASADRGRSRRRRHPGKAYSPYAGFCGIGRGIDPRPDNDEESSRWPCDDSGRTREGLVEKSGPIGVGRNRVIRLGVRQGVLANLPRGLRDLNRPHPKGRLEPVRDNRTAHRDRDDQACAGRPRQLPD